MGEPAYVAVNRRLRPLRFAFLVRPDDSESLLKAIQLNTCLWGGRFNPIIPVFRRLPGGWSDDLFERHPEISKQLTARAKRRIRRFRTHAREFVRGYLDAFEPDYLVEMTPGLAKDVTFEESLILKPDQIIPPEGAYPSDLRVGLSVLSLYQNLYGQQFRFVEKQPPRVVTARASKGSLSLFVAACFGSFPSIGELARFGEAYKAAFSPDEVEIDGSNFFDGIIGPLRLGAQGLRVMPRGWRRDFTIFLLDETRLSDLIDYWNLRALGWPVVPVPTQWQNEAVEPCRRQVQAVYRPLRGNPQIMNTTTLLLSRTVTNAEGLSFAKATSAPTDPAHQPQPSVSLQQWYPRIWDKWAREKDGCERPEVVAEEDEVECQLEGANAIRFKSLDPPFMRDSLSFGAGWANVVRITDYSFNREIGTVVPSDAAHLERLLGTVGAGEISISSEGIVIRCRYRRWTHRWNLPSGLQIFSSWLGQRGFTTGLSAAGRLTSALIRSAEGIHGVQAIAHPEILRKLNKMAHGDVEQETDDAGARQTRVRAPFESHREWWKLLLQITKSNPEAAQNYLNLLVGRRALAIGLRSQCPICSQFGWHSLEDLSENLKCDRCLNRFPFPAASPPKEGDWCYRTQGPFSVGDFAQGGYCVALAIRFLASTLHAEASWVPSLILRKQGKELEVDFALFWRESRFEPTEPLLMLGECKSYNRFSRRDLARARQLVEVFPGSALVFATLRPELEPTERDSLARLVLWGRKRLRYERLRAPVLVLTQHELLNVFGPPICWREAGGKYATFATSWHSQDFLHLCDATQQLHLEMESDASWYMKDIEHRRQRAMRFEARAAAKEAGVAAEVPGAN